MLNGVLRLHNLDGTICERRTCSRQHVDLERLCASVIRKKGDDLQPDKRDDCLAFLLSEGWRLSLVYDPKRNPNTPHHANGGFAGWAATVLRTRSYPEWQRQSEGRTRWVFSDRIYERPRPQLVSADTDGGGRAMDDALARSPEDSPHDRLTDLGWILGSRARPSRRRPSQNRRREAA